MSIVFTPKNYRESLAWFASIPFYNLQNLLKKDQLTFNDGEISKVEKCEGPISIYRIHYARKDFFGDFITSEFPPEGLMVGNFTSTSSNVFFKTQKSFAKRYLFQFYLQSPALSIIVLFLLLYGIIANVEVLNLGHFLKAENFISSLCNRECAVKASKAMVTAILTSIILGLPILVSSLFYFVISKKQKDARLFMLIRTESMIIMLVFSFLFFAILLSRI